MEKIMKKILTAVLSLAMVACFVPQTGMQAYAADGDPALPVAIRLVTNGAAPNIPGGQGGSTDGGVWFGNYMQSSVETKEPVKWRVLQNADGKLLLLSDQNLDGKRYSNAYKAVTWASTSIRTWLNGTFIADAFCR